MSQLVVEPNLVVVESLIRPAPDREPMTPARSQRRDDLLHSLCDLVTVTEDAHTMEYWQLGVFGAFKPRNAWEDWAGQQASVMMFRISRSERIERRLRDLQSLRAIDFWEEDQRLKAEETATKLLEEPGPTYAALWSTVAGCDWLIGRWQALAQTSADAWNEAQQQFVRLVCPIRPSQTLTPGFAQKMVDLLQDQRERNRDADRAFRALVEADLSDEISKPLARIRRYRASLQRELKWYIAQLRMEPPQHRLDHRFHPDYDRQMLEPYPPATSAHDPASELVSNELAPEAEPTPISTPIMVEQHAPAETNPTAEPVVDAENDGTNPFDAAATESSLSQPVIEESLAAPNQCAHPVPGSDRKKRPDPQRELARRRKAARRRSR